MVDELELELGLAGDVGAGVTIDKCVGEDGRDDTGVDVKDDFGVDAKDDFGEDDDHVT